MRITKEQSRIQYLLNQALIDFDEFDKNFNQKVVVFYKDNELEDYEVYLDENEIIEVYEDEKYAIKTIYEFMLELYILYNKLPVENNMCIALRMLMDKTMQEMADYFGVSKQFWNNIEKGIKKPSQKILQSIMTDFYIPKKIED